MFKRLFVFWRTRLFSSWTVKHVYLLRVHRCMMDSDDEVRDRATFYMNVLQQKQKALNAAYIFNGEDSHSTLSTGFKMASDGNMSASVCLRTVRVRPWAGEVPPPVHLGALRETFRHEVCTSGHHSHHRAENGYNPFIYGIYSFSLLKKSD